MENFRRKAREPIKHLFCGGVQEFQLLEGSKSRRTREAHTYIIHRYAVRA
jgi:hypothetical protein